jgi:hypothetical protein
MSNVLVTTLTDEPGSVNPLPGGLTGVIANLA